MSHLAWEFLRISQEELESVAGHWDIWNTLLDLLPLLPDHRKAGEWTDGAKSQTQHVKETN